MSYSGVRRPTRLGRFGLLASTVLAGVALWWFIFVSIRPTHSSGGMSGFIAGVAVSLVIAILLHESGHLVAGLAGGEPVRKIRIGTGATLVGFRVRGLAVQVCINPITGGAVYFSRISAAPRRMHLLSLAAGPGTNLVMAACAFPLYESGVSWLGPFVLANVILFVGSSVPSTTTQGGRQHSSDGMQLLNLLLRPPVPTTNYDGDEMGRDAHAVLARAGEDAQLSGATEVTDENLLRALDQDASVGAFFAAAGLRARIPTVPNAGSDVLTRPSISSTTMAILTASFQQCRDLGIQKPNAAGFCLGLLAVDCPAGRLMKAAGISEEAVRTLVTSATPDEEDLRRARVISADLPLERWGTAADLALAQAVRTAIADRSPFVGTQHLIASVMADPLCRGYRALDRLGFSLRWNRDTRTAESPPPGAPILSPQAGLAIAGAMWRTGPVTSTGTSDLILGILDQMAGIGAQILISAGITARDVEKALRLTPAEASQPVGCTASARGMWMLRGSARVGSERWLDARADFLDAQRAAVTDLQRALCDNNVAWVSLMSGDPSLRAEALERSRAALAVQPDQVAFQGTRAFALLESGSPLEAAALLESILPRQRRPRSLASDLCVLAMCRARLGQRDAAVKHLEAAAESDPKCPLLARARAEAESAIATTPVA